MERQQLQTLKKWKTKKNRQPMIIWGARQTGKTWLMKEFGKRCFKNAVYISFYNNKRIAGLFEDDYDSKRIIGDIEIMLDVKINPDDTLLIFDEIQSAPKVVESLKYFAEDTPEYALVCAGSLLGVAIHEGISFPVGKIDQMHLYPLSFEEFLNAIGQNSLAEALSDLEKSNHFSMKYKEYLMLYYVVGGMPGVVAEYIESKDLDSVRELQINILSQYEGDFGKHIEARQLPRVKMVWESVPIQLAKENKKFFFGQIKKGARQKDYEIAIQWLVDSGLLYKVNKVTKPAIPLKAYMDSSTFKLFFIDVGLLGALSELDFHSILKGSDIFTEYKGALTEQFVLQELICYGQYTPYYYSGKNSTYEMDFMIQKDNAITPIEVKAEENLRSKSLKAFYDKYNPTISIRISKSNFRKEDWLVNYPLWAVGRL